MRKYMLLTALCLSGCSDNEADDTSNIPRTVVSQGIDDRYGFVTKEKCVQVCAPMVVTRYRFHEYDFAVACECGTAPTLEK